MSIKKDEWIKMWHAYIMDSYSALNKMKFTSKQQKSPFRPIKTNMDILSVKSMIRKIQSVEPQRLVVECETRKKNRSPQEREIK